MRCTAAVTFSALAAFLLGSHVARADSGPDAGAGVTFTAKPTVAGGDGGLTIRFAVSAPTDVEVAIINGAGEVVRHLAAGLLGQPAPPASTAPDANPGIVPPLKPGLAQEIRWDGTDDYGRPGPLPRRRRRLFQQPISARLIIGGHGTRHIL